jgi:hypothetical protein
MNVITATELRKTSKYEYHECHDDDYECESVYNKARYHIWVLQRNCAGVGLRNLNEATRVSALASLLWYRDFLTEEPVGVDERYDMAKEQLLWELKGILESAGVVGY